MPPGLCCGVLWLLPIPADRSGCPAGVCPEQASSAAPSASLNLSLRQAGRGRRQRACHGDGPAAWEERRSHLGHGTGGWVIEDYYHFRGKKYTETTSKLGEFPVDASGRLDARFTIPEDYGGVHEVSRSSTAKPSPRTASRSRRPSSSRRRPAPSARRSS